MLKSRHLFCLLSQDATKINYRHQSAIVALVLFYLVIENIFIQKFDMSAGLISLLRYIVLLGYFLLYMMISGFKFVLIDRSIKLPFVVFIASSFLTFFFNPNVDALVRVISAVGYYFIFKTLVIMSSADQVARLDLVKRICGVFAVYVLITLPAVTLSSSYYFERLQGLTSNPNELGSVCFMALAAFYILRKHYIANGTSVALVNTATALSFVLLFMTKSKGALLSVIFFGATSMLSSTWLIAFIALLPTLAVLYVVKLLDVDSFIAMYSHIYSNFQEPLLKVRLDPSSIKYRLHFAQVFMDNYFFSNAKPTSLLFGRGLKTFDKQIPLDNAFLFTFYEQGLVSLLFVVSFMMVIIKHHKKFVNSNSIYRYYTAFCVSLIFYSNFESRLFLGINYLTLLFIVVYVFICYPTCRTMPD